MNNWSPAGVPTAQDVLTFNTIGGNVSGAASLKQLVVRNTSVDWAVNGTVYSLGNPASWESFVIGASSGQTAALNLSTGSLSGSSATIGQGTGSRGTLAMASGQLSLEGDLLVGSAGIGTLRMTNTAFVDVKGDAYVGRLPGSAGNVFIDSSRPIWRIGGDLFIGGGTSAGGVGAIDARGQLIVAGDTRVFGSGTLRVSGTMTTGGLRLESGSTFGIDLGHVTVEGGQLWSAGGLSLGSTGGAAAQFPLLRLHKGAAGNINGVLALGEAPGAKARLELDGVRRSGTDTAVASLQGTAGLVVGGRGTGYLTITNGASAQFAGHAVIARDPGSLGDLVVRGGYFTGTSGGTSVLRTTGASDLVVGDKGRGNVSVNHYALIDVGRDVLLAPSTSGNAALALGAFVGTEEGPAELRVARDLWVGGGPGGGGGTASVSVRGTGILNVAGTTTVFRGSSISASDFRARFQTGNLDIRGGTVSAGDPLVLAPNAAITVTGGGSLRASLPLDQGRSLSVSGAGSSATLTRWNFDVPIGVIGSGSLSVSDGGRIDSGTWRVNVAIGASSLANVNLSGPGFRWTLAELNLAQGGRAEVTLANDAHVEVTRNLFAASNSGSVANLTLNGSGVVLRSGGLFWASRGRATLNARSGTVISHNAEIGLGSTNAAGLMVFDGPNSALDLSGSLRLGSGSITVTNGASARVAHGMEMLVGSKFLLDGSLNTQRLTLSSSAATFEQTGGSAVISPSGTTTVPGFHVGMGGGPGWVNVNGSTLRTTSAYVGASGPGSVAVTSGKWDVNGSLHLGGSTVPGVTARVQLWLSDLNVTGTLKLSPAVTLDLSQSKIKAGALEVPGGVTFNTSGINLDLGAVVNDGVFTWSRGVNNPGITASVGRVSGSGVMTVSAGFTADSIRQDTFNVLGGGVKIEPDTGASDVSVVRSLNVGQGQLDLTTAAIVVDHDATSDPFADLRARIISAFGPSLTRHWTGAGLTSSTAASDPEDLGVGYGRARDLLGLADGQTGVFLGQTMDSTAVIARTTILGDANLDGAVSFADFQRFERGFGRTGDGAQWAAGDFNYDAAVDAADFTLLFSHFGDSMSAGMVVTPQAADVAALEAFAAAHGIAVPEPAASAVLLLGAACRWGLGRRRRVSADP